MCRVIYRLTDGSAEGLQLWKKWLLERNPKTSPSKAEQEWTSDEVQTVKVELSTKEALVVLDKWVKDDAEEIKPASNNAKPKDYMAACHQLGYEFSINDMNDRLYCNGQPMTDATAAFIMTQLGDLGFKSSDVFQRAALAEGHEHRFHPIRDYLNNLKWDSKDRFEEMGEYIKDKRGMFSRLLRKFMIGAVAKVLDPKVTEQNPMLVLSARQKIGKSSFVAWLGGPLQDLYNSAPLHPDDKDWQGYATSYFIWEVAELESTISRQDVAALKWFISQWRFTWTPRYGHFETTKTVTASYIGTINPNGTGFLNDPTGNRRFRVCDATDINFDYKDVDINQLWAQAVALHKQGETNELDDMDAILVNEANSGHEVEEPIEEAMAEFLELGETRKDWRVSVWQILTVLKARGLIIDPTRRDIQMRVSAILTKWGCEKSDNPFRINGKLGRGYIGVRLDPVAEMQASQPKTL